MMKDQNQANMPHLDNLINKGWIHWASSTTTAISHETFKTTHSF